MSDKTYKVVDGCISDGYHTFDELYEHRHLLFLGCLRSGFFKDQTVCEDHHDGWDCITAYTSAHYQQISYHIPKRYRIMYEHIERVSKDEQEKRFDKHDSKLVAHRVEMSLRHWDLEELANKGERDE